MQQYQYNMIIISHDYKVVINIHKVIIQHNVKLNISTFECGEQAITHVRGYHRDSNR
jgi:hypothetical protein